MNRATRLSSLSPIQNTMKGTLQRVPFRRNQSRQEPERVLKNVNTVIYANPVCAACSHKVLHD